MGNEFPKQKKRHLCLMWHSSNLPVFIKSINQQKKDLRQKLMLLGLENVGVLFRLLTQLYIWSPYTRVSIVYKSLLSLEIFVQHGYVAF